MFIASSRAFALWLDLACLVYIGLVTFSFLFLDRGNGIQTISFPYSDNGASPKGHGKKYLTFSVPC
jgi:hypothetical protein